MRRLSGGGLPVPEKPFGPYVVDLPIGQGGMGAVYRARDPKLGRVLALKVMLPSEAEDAESRARFIREARLAAALEHPGIVRIYEVGEVEGTPYIAMEWIDGQTLRLTKLADPNAVLERIAETLAFAHAHGVVHRDLKPANVIVDAHGDPKLVDFGIAKRVAASATFATQDGMVLGTPKYMAPEQMLSSAVDARADQYAWGVMAYELLTGERPLRPALAHAALDEHRGTIVLRALSEAPSDRFASMDALLEAWRARREDQGPAPIAGPRPAPTQRRSNALWLFGGAVASSIVVAAIGFGVLHHLRPKTDGAIPAPASASPSAIAPVPPPEPSASSAPSEPAEVTPASSTSKSDAGPVLRRATGVADIAVGGEHVYKEDATKFRAAVLLAYPKCVAGIPLRGNTPIHVEYDVLQPPHPGYVTVTVYSASSWPPPATSACLERETLAVEVRPMPDASHGRVYITVRLR